MKVVDVHTHVGSCRVFDLNLSVDELLSTMKKNEIGAVITQPFPGAPNVKKVHDQIARLSEENPGKIFGLASLNPHQDDEEYLAELDRLVKDCKFVGVKLHTIGHAVNPLSNDAKKVFEAAKRLKIPVMVHTGPGVPLSLPANVIPRAQEYPDVSIILAHAGNGMVISSEIGPVASVCRNVFLETSWSSILEKSFFTKLIGSERVMFGSDLTINCTTELQQYQSLGLEDKELERVLYSNANRVFRLGL